MLQIRDAIANRVRILVASEPATGPRLDDPGDAGLFGPASASWRVHGDFTSMMIGGVTALLVQMLHPRALAGVWDHSNFRQDMGGRLRRTAQFIAGTTYGTTARAAELIERVRGVHDRVRGETPDGEPYSAHDPDLLTWIHVAEVNSFLSAYLRHRDPTFPPSEQDRYLAEQALIAERLGAARDGGCVPRSRAEVEAYFHAVRPQLRCDDRAREIARVILARPSVSPASQPFARLMLEAAQDLLPPWAAGLHGLHVSPARRPVIRLGVQAMGGVLRWSMYDSAETRARRRTASP